MQANRARATCFRISVAALLSACGDDDGASRSRLPYDADKTILIGADGTDVQSTPSGTACIDLTNGECVQPQRECGEDAYADVLLDSQGEVIDVVCLPTNATTPIVAVEDGSATLTDDGAVVILDPADRQGSIVVKGNEAILYGDSPAKTVIDGDLTLQGNESTVRGVTVTGDLKFEGNSAELYYCVIHGDVVLKGNNNFISNCTIFGSIIGSGNDDEIVSNYVDGSITLGGSPDECRDNRIFTDADKDMSLDAAEATAAKPLECRKK